MDQKQWLAHYFVTQITQKTVNIQGRIERALGAIDKLLEKGWTVEEIKNELDLFAKMYPQVVKNIYHLEEIIGNKQPPGNLMEPDVFYYHNALRVTSAPTQLKYNPELKRYERIEPEFFLEMKKCFTMKDLLQYWYKSNGMTPTEHNIKQDTGRFEYLLGLYDLDEILFMIDIAQATRKDNQQKPLRNVFELEKFIEEAREAIQLKKNAHRLEGIDRIIKRREG
jgi:hypothetical protein